MLVHASWREGLGPAHWKVDLSLGSLVGRTVSKDMLRGGNKLRKSLGSLSADGWSCVLPS